MYVQQEASQHEEDCPPHQGKERTENHPGRSKPKSYTIEFKKQTLDLLDNLSSSRNKWQKVADAKQVSKSLAVKWNKAGNSILSEIAKNKQKTNAGSAREKRHRRQMVGARAQNREKYPLASKLLNTEFKFCTSKRKQNFQALAYYKDETETESCYGKEEASKFKTSNN